MRCRELCTRTVICAAVLLVLVGQAAIGATFYVDPVNGSMAGDGSAGNPWSTLADVISNDLIESQKPAAYPYNYGDPLVARNAGAPVQPGDTLLLLSGDHGTIFLQGYFNADWITVKAQTGETPVLRRIHIRGGCYWHFDGVTVSQEPYGTVDTTTAVDLETHSYHGPTYDCIIENSHIYGVDDTSTFDVAAWQSQTPGTGVASAGPRTIIRNNTIRNIRLGVNIGGDDSLIEYNTLIGIAHDGFRSGGDRIVWQYNQLSDFVDIDDNHDDMIQMYRSGGVPHVGVIIRGNFFDGRIIAGRPLSTSPQGVGCFGESNYLDCVVENNVVLTANYHGISFYGAEDSIIANNTVLDPSRQRVAWIKTPDSENVTVRNNMSYQIPASGGGVVADHNIELTDALSDQIFVDWRNGDVRLKAGSPAIDAGDGTNAPTVDIDGNPRPQGNDWDVGAYESSGTGNQVPVADAGPDQVVTDTDDNGSESITLDGSGSSDSDGTIVSYVWEENSSQIATGVSPLVTLSVAVHTIDLTVTDDDTATDSDSVVITVNAGGLPDAFLQDSGAQGIVSMEGENFDANTPQGGHDWNFYATPAGASGTGSMRAEPDTGTSHDAGYAANSPRLDFQVNFVKTGTHYVWIRGYATDGTDDSCHAGIGGAENATAYQIAEFPSTNAWSWTGVLKGGSTRATIDVAATGVQTVNVWMREDGFRIDKIVLTTDSGYTPSGYGPAESSRGGGSNAPPVADAGTDQNVTDNDDNGSEDVTLDGSGSSDSDGTIVSYVWEENSSQIATGISPVVTLSVNVHTIDLVVTDDDSDTATDSVIVTVNAYVNVPPTADAGPDQSVDDADDNGSEDVTLDGSGSSDSDGTIVSYVWEENSSQIATGVSPTVTLSVATHTIDLTVTDDDSATDTDSVVITVEAATGAYLQDSGTQGIVSMEAENYDGNISQGGHDWNFYTTPADASGGGCMRAEPDTGVSYDTGYAANSPRLDFQVNFVKTGTHYVWIRGYKIDGTADSCHAGIGGAETATAYQIADFPLTNAWSWTGTLKGSSARATIHVASTGVQTVNVWMREDGFRFDKIVLTTDSGYTPSGSGPAESPRSGSNDAPIADAGPDQNVTDNDDNGSEDVTLDGSGSSDSDGTIVSYVWEENSSQVATGVSPAVSLAVGVHTIDLTVTDDDAATGADSLTVTVNEAPNAPPTADAGSDQNVNDADDSGDENITLNGSGSSDSDGTIVSYDWEEASVPIATGVSPTVSVAVGVHTIDLTVTDDDSDTDSDSVVITVTEYVNVSPTADAGPDQSVNDADDSGAEDITLDGSGSSDSDGTIISYDWEDASVPIATGVSPTVSIAVGVHTVDLIVTDDDSATDTDSVLITVTAYVNQPPTADAGPDQTLEDSDGDSSEDVTLDGSGSSDSDGTIVSYAWEENSSQIAIGVAPVVALDVNVHTIDLIVTDDDGATDTDSVVITVEASTGAYLQDSGPQGILSMEAENYDDNISQGGQDWNYYTTPADASGGGCMRAEPDTGVSNNTGYAANSPRLDFQVNFVKTGTHYVWIRGYKIDGTDDSCHVGIGGVENTTADRISSFPLTNDWSWTGKTMDSSARATINVAATGVQTVNVWMREDGFRIDKIVLTTDSGYTPSGFGPAESPRGGSNAPPVADAGTDQTVEDVDGNGAEDVTLDGSGSSDSDGTIISYVWEENSSQIATGVAPTVTLDVGVHTIDLTVTDDDSDTDTDSVVVTVVSGTQVSSTSDQVWPASTLPAQTGVFTVEYDAVPASAGMDGVTGLSYGAAAWWDELACIVRFNTSNTIDARNGGAYAADATVSYTAGVSYHFRLVVDVPNKTYSVYVTPDGGSETTVATDFAFRAEQQSITSIDNWTLNATNSVGTHTVSNLTITD